MGERERGKDKLNIAPNDRVRGKRGATNGS